MGKLFRLRFFDMRIFLVFLIMPEGKAIKAGICMGKTDCHAELKPFPIGIFAGQIRFRNRMQQTVPDGFSVELYLFMGVVVASQG